MNISIVDYGMGNIHSLKSIVDFVGGTVCVTDSPEAVKNADKLILPGVGSYSKAADILRSTGLFDAVQEVMQKERPVLGICLGMQLLAQSSTEDGGGLGFGCADCYVEGFDLDKLGANDKVPHVGFNEISIVNDSLLLEGLNDRADFYFTHSFRMMSRDESVVTSYCTNGERFVASLETGNIFGTQFHPELSQDNGIRLIRNFVERT